MNQNFQKIPKISFIHTKDELKSDKEDLFTKEYINKKRKLSEDYSQESTNTRKESMTDSFTNLQNYSAVNPLRNISTDFSVNIPKPIRANFSNKKVINGANNNFNENQKLVDNLFKMKLNDLSKPFTNYFQKQELEKSAGNVDEMKAEENPNDSKPSINKYSSFPLFYFPFGVPLCKTKFSEYLQQNLEDLKKNQSQTPTLQYVGPLTLEERAEKINRYLEKKKKRKWKYVRYNIRKDLADQRQRVQGRFVKTNKIKFPFLLNEPKDMSGSMHEEFKSDVDFMEKSNNSL